MASSLYQERDAAYRARVFRRSVLLLIAVWAGAIAGVAHLLGAF